MENISALCSISLGNLVDCLVDLLAQSDHVRLKVSRSAATSPWKLFVGLSYLSKIWTWEFTVGSKNSVPQLSLAAEMVFGTSGKEIVNWAWAQSPTLVRALSDDGSFTLLSDVKKDPSQKCTRHLTTLEDNEVLNLLEIADGELIVLCKATSAFHFYHVSQKEPEYLCSLPKMENEPNPVMCIVSMHELSAAQCAQLFEADAARFGGNLLVIGSHVGDVYGFPLNRQSNLSVLCRLYQPMVAAFTIGSQNSDSSSGLLFVGQEGKLLMISLQNSKIAIQTDFMNGPVVQCCCFRSILFVNTGNCLRRVKIEVQEKSGKFISEDHCYPVKSVRAFTIIPDTVNRIVCVLTEDAVVYTFPYDLPVPTQPQLRFCMDTIMGQLECVGQEMKNASERRIRATERLEQSSLALNLLNRHNLEELIAIDMRTYPVTDGVDEEYLLLDIENKSHETFLPGYWSLCISLGSIVISCVSEPLIKPWRPGEVTHINRRVRKQWESDDDVSFHLNLHFIADDTFIPIPVCSATLNVLNFLEPSSSHLGPNAVEGQSFEDFLLDVAKTKPAAPLFRQIVGNATDQTEFLRTVEVSMSSELSLAHFAQHLLEGSYHRGFEHVEFEESPNALHMPLRVCGDRIEIDLTKREDIQRCVVRISCYDKKLLQTTVKVIMERIGFLMPSEGTQVPISEKSVHEIKRLKRRLDFIVALPNVESRHVRLTMEHFKEIFVELFPMH